MLRIYLSGSIQKGEEDGRESVYFWTKEDERELLDNIISPVKLLNPANVAIRRNNFYTNYGCDLFLVKTSKVVVVDLRRSKGIGVGAELMYAATLGIPVLGWLPSGSVYRREFVANIQGEDLYDWIHPFAYGLCDKHLATLGDIALEINRMVVNNEFSKQSFRSPEHAVCEFVKSYPDIAKDADE